MTSWKKVAFAGQNSIKTCGLIASEITSKSHVNIQWVLQNCLSAWIHYYT